MPHRLGRVCEKPPELYCISDVQSLDLILFTLREFPLVTEVFSSKRLFDGMPSNPLRILNVSIRFPDSTMSSKV